MHDPDKAHFRDSLTMGSLVGLTIALVLWVALELLHLPLLIVLPGIVICLGLLAVGLNLRSYRRWPPEDAP